MATDDSKQDTPKVPDHATDELTGEEVANAAADTLHGQRAAEEKYEQPAATVLPAGSATLIAKDEPGQPDGRRDV